MSGDRVYTTEFQKGSGSAFTVNATAREAADEIDDKTAKGWVVHQILRDDVEIREDELRLDVAKERASR